MDRQVARGALEPAVSKIRCNRSSSRMQIDVPTSLTCTQPTVVRHRWEVRVHPMGDHLCRHTRISSNLGNPPQISALALLKVASAQGLHSQTTLYHRRALASDLTFLGHHHPWECIRDRPRVSIRPCHHRRWHRIQWGRAKTGGHPDHWA